MKSTLLIGFVSCLLIFADANAREPVVQTETFRFYSHFETNLNDALIASGVARNFGRDELFHAGAEQACFDALAPSVRAGWNRAVDYYAEIVSPHQFNARQQVVLRLHLAALPVTRDERERQYLAVADGFMAAAARAYRACRWQMQDEKNRQWLQQLVPQLEEHEQGIAARLATLYGVSWPESLFDVDIVETVSWAGANSFFPEGSAGHILVASEPEALESLETVFHEASHGFMLGGDPLREALSDAARDRGIDPPKDLWHVVLFVTTGETVRKALETAGETDYEPMIYEIYTRSDWGRYREAMNAVWPDYLDGERTARDAIAAVIARMESSPQ